MDSPVIVPMELDVLLANTALMDRDQFRLWYYSYASMRNKTWSDPEPPAFTDGHAMPGRGAYLHWTLPRSLRVGKADSTSDFPLIPNRWLIVRIYRDAGGQNVQQTWMLEADCPNPDNDPNSCYFIVNDTVKNNWAGSGDTNRSGAFLIPFDQGDNSDTQSYYLSIGRAFDLSGWKEAYPENMFITALGPGNAEFCGYIGFNLGVLSFYDSLAGVPDTTSLSYMVTGWYADPGSDILVTGNTGFTGAATADAVLTALNWQLAQGQSAGDSNITLYSGMSFNLPWNATAEQPPANDELQKLRDSRHMSVCVANTGLEAFSTLVATQLENMQGYTDPGKTLELLRAFQFDLLPELNNVNGTQLVNERIQQAWFNAHFGGNRWKIVPSTENQQAAGYQISAGDAAWLQQLNQDQQALDEALTQLLSLQWDLNAVWWKYHSLQRTLYNADQNWPKISADQLKPYLDPDDPKSTMGQVLAQLKVVNDLLPKVPQPQKGVANQQDALQQGIATFAQSKQISAGYVLKAVAQPRYWLPNNPNIIVSGVSLDPLGDPGTALQVRLPSQLIQSFTIDNQQISASTLGNIIPSLTSAQPLPANVQDIYTEFFLLDPANAAQIAQKTGLSPDDVYNAMNAHETTCYTTGVLPAFDLSEWQQQWSPLFMEWQMTHTPVPFAWQNTPNWTFDGTDYKMTASPQGQGTPYIISGRAALSTHTQMTFGARLKAFARQYNDGDLNDLWKEINDTDQWRFLSQELADTNDYLAQRDKRLYRKPGHAAFTYQNQQLTYSKIMGYPDDTNIYPFDTPSFAQGLVNTLPAVNKDGPSEFPFHQVRGGEFYFTQLVIYDKFGRILELVQPADGGVFDADSFPLMVDTAFAVEYKLSAGINAPFQVPPRVLQPSRLNMLLADYRDKSNVLGITSDVNPICGWVVVNHVDKSLLLFFPDGSNAGEILLLADTNGMHIQWTPPPNNNLVSLKDVGTRSKQLGAFATALIAKTPTAFDAFLKAIDSTLWTVDPLGKRTDQDLSLFIGRPLALVALTLQLKLNGQVLKSEDWPFPLQDVPPDPHVPSLGACVFDVRFGDQASREDGVIGYFEAENYDLFNCVVTPDSSDNYLQQIGPLDSDNGNYVQLSFDDADPVYLTVLADPRASIHAFTGILPVKEVKLPEEFVEKPLSSLDITFRAGPVLSAIQPSDQMAGQPLHADALTYLPVSAKFGVWSWWQSTVADPGTSSASFSWQGYTLTKATTTADFNKYTSSLHDGYLQFITDQDSK
ncbi:hypothetical protein HF329_09435 [Chitinophaga oryzae]|uniref:Uncharacterized protein n=1 Tax=Chitinophaga oryzae TaxID=2725414 RepID=A0AAE7D6A5_9BACT|nr:hypothetical protein [Chitinophaga oryzae]QJB31515.1 hypothetical protein HF329_09435 [Chitinophaga oryzae]